MFNLRQQLPPLDALVMFDAAARHLSFTRAAEELNITQAAVSRQIRILERDLGVRLFVRSHRAVELSPQGREFQHTVASTLVQLAKAANHVRNLPLVRLAVAADQAVAGLWLTPRLLQFRRLHSGVSIRLVVSDYEPDCLKDEIDVAIIHGDGSWPLHNTELLFAEEVLPVCSPSYIEQNRPISSPSDLIEHSLVDHEDEHWNWMNWRMWLARHEVDLPPEHHKLQINNYNLVIQAAREGQGIGLGWRCLVDDMLAAGELVRPLPATVRTEFGYHLLTHKNRPLGPDVEAFVSWVVETHRRDQEANAYLYPAEMATKGS